MAFFWLAWKHQSVSQSVSQTLTLTHQQGLLTLGPNPHFLG